jgi:Family of unknown function (DUF6790)
MTAAGTESSTGAKRQPAALRVLAEWPVLTPVVGFGVAEVVQLAQHGTSGFHRATLLNGLVYLIGVAGIIAASGHLLKADDVARSIGWPPGSPFQWEVGVADLGWGVLGVLCPLYGRDFWLATIIVASIFLLGAAVGHVRQMIVARNFSPGNAGGVFFADVAIPIVLIVLYATYNGPA